MKALLDWMVEDMKLTRKRAEWLICVSVERRLGIETDIPEYSNTLLIMCLELMDAYNKKYSHYQKEEDEKERNTATRAAI